MAITAKFLADFDQFNAAAQAAETQLRLVTTQTDAVAAGMTKAGQASTVSAQMIAGMSAAATTATGHATTLTGAFHQFDGVLASLGVHIGPEIKGLEDLAGAAGKSATEVGLLGTAGLIAGAALAGWKVGRLIADFFDLDEAIGNATAKLLGFGDVAAQEAGAKADVLARASKEAGHQITDLGVAMRINNDAFTKHQKGAVEAAKGVEAWTAAMVEVNAAGQGWQGTLDTIDGETVDAIKFYLDAGVAQGKLATAYGLTDVQVKAVASSLAEEAKATAEVAAETARLEVEFAKVSLAVGNLQDLMAGAKGLTPAISAAATEFLRLGASPSDVATAFNLSAGSVKFLADELTKATAAQQIHLNASNAAVQAELEAHLRLNAAQGLDAEGHLKVAGAAETLRLKLHDLDNVRQAGFSQLEQIREAELAYVAALNAEAAAANQVLVVGTGMNAALERGAAVAQGTAQSFAGLSVQIAASAEQMAAFYATLALHDNVGTPGANNIGTPSGGVANLATASAAAVSTLNRVPRFADGGPTSAGLAWVHNDEYVVPSGGALVMHGGGGGTTTSTTIHIYVTQPLGTPAAIAAAVDQALMARQRNTGQRMPVA